MEKKYRANPAYLIRKVADEYLLVATDNEAFSGNKLMMLNETGRFIWENLQNFSSLEELIDKAKKEFSDDNGLLRQEMLEFVTSLIQIGLIEERSYEK